MDFSRQDIPARAVHVNGIGYFPGRPKSATVVCDLADGEAFSVVDGKGRIAYAGTLGPASSLPGMEEGARRADFSALAENGSYRIRVGGPGLESPPFRVGDGVYDDSLRLCMIGFYGQRCGAPLRFERGGIVYAKDACHLEDGYLDHYDRDRAGERKDGTGGWHDAGDYGKYVVNAGFATGILLRAWERFAPFLSRLSLPIPESGGPLPDFLAEAKYNLDWMLKMQFPDGRVSHKLTRLDFEPMEAASLDRDKRYFAPWGTDATACLAAVAAQASRVFRPYDPAYAASCLEASTKALAVLKESYFSVAPDLSAFRTGWYLKPGHSDREWAFAEYWETTGDEDSLARYERSLATDNFRIDVDWDWGGGRNLGAYAYLGSSRKRDAGLAKGLESDLVAAADRIIARSRVHPFGRGLSACYWGCNGSIARTALNLQAAYDVTGNGAYRDAILEQLSYLYGVNPYGRSFVTGEGKDPPRFPHHRPSVGDGIEAPWPGHLVGGPHPGELDWHDVMEDARTNETAINWDASLAFALAAFQGEESGTPRTGTR